MITRFKTFENIDVDPYNEEIWNEDQIIKSCVGKRLICVDEEYGTFSECAIFTDKNEDGYGLGISGHYVQHEIITTWMKLSFTEEEFIRSYINKNGEYGRNLYDPANDEDIQKLSRQMGWIGYVKGNKERILKLINYTREYFNTDKNIERDKQEGVYVKLNEIF